MRNIGLLLLGTALVFANVGCADDGTVNEPVNEPVDLGGELNVPPPNAFPTGPTNFNQLSLTSDTITFSNPSQFSDATLPAGLAFDEGRFRVTSFDHQPPSPTSSGHFHLLINGFEGHHFQGNNARQGVRIRRIDGANFNLKSIHHRSGGFSPNTPFEIGTSAPGGFVGSPPVLSGYTQFPVTSSGTFVTIPITGFENVNVVFITQRGGGDWDNIVLASSVIEVDLDIKPGSDPNSINPKSKGVIPVAILGSSTFNVTDVDVSTLKFGPGEAAPTRNAGGHLEDVNSDGFTDLVSHYNTQDSGILSGDTEACVTGETNAGVPLEGCDSVRVK